jgi:hypothetical protein
MTRRELLCPVAVLALSTSLAAQTPVKGAKELFYDPTDGNVTSAAPAAPAAPKQTGSSQSGIRVSPVKFDGRGRRKVSLPAPTEGTANLLGLSYWIELQGAQGRPGTQVANGRVFHSGERIRLHFRSNVEGNIALIQIGSSGTSQFLFPNPGLKLTDSRLSADQDRILPNDRSWFRFDANPGTERLIVMFAHRPDELGGLAGSRDLGTEETGSLLRTVQQVKGSKDLLVETETRTAGEVGTYAINLMGQPVVLEIILEHR